MADALALGDPLAAAEPLAVGDAVGQVSAILAGLGIAQLPTWAVKHQIEQGLLVEVLPDLATDGLPMNLVWLKSRQYLPKVKLLLELLAGSLTPAGRVDAQSL